MKLSLFLLPIFISYVGIELILRYITKSEYEAKAANIERVLPELEILILGSSHGLRGINPNEFDKSAYSMAMFSQQLKMDYDIFQKYQADAPNLKYVILPISIFSLDKDIHDGSVKNRLPFYAFYYNLFYQDKMNNFINSISLVNVLGFKKSISGLMSIGKKRKPVNCDELGWLGSKESLKTQKEYKANAAEAVERHETKANDFRNLIYLESLIQESKLKGIKVVLVNTPKTKWYIDKTNTKKRHSINKKLKALSEEFANVIFMDYEDSSLFVLDDFADADHLSSNGAKKLTNLIENQIHEN